VFGTKGKASKAPEEGVPERKSSEFRGRCLASGERTFRGKGAADGATALKSLLPVKKAKEALRCGRSPSPPRLGGGVRDREKRRET